MAAVDLGVGLTEVDDAIEACRTHYEGVIAVLANELEALHHRVAQQAEITEKRQREIDSVRVETRQCRELVVSLRETIMETETALSKEESARKVAEQRYSRAAEELTESHELLATKERENENYRRQIQQLLHQQASGLSSIPPATQQYSEVRSRNVYPAAAAVEVPAVSGAATGIEAIRRQRPSSHAHAGSALVPNTIRSPDSLSTLKERSGSSNAFQLGKEGAPLNSPSLLRVSRGLIPSSGDIAIHPVRGGSTGVANPLKHSKSQFGEEKISPRRNGGSSAMLDLMEHYSTGIDYAPAKKLAFASGSLPEAYCVFSPVLQNSSSPSSPSSPAFELTVHSKNLEDCVCGTTPHPSSPLHHRHIRCFLKGDGYFAAVLDNRIVLERMYDVSFQSKTREGEAVRVQLQYKLSSEGQCEVTVKVNDQRYTVEPLCLPPVFAQCVMCPFAILPRAGDCCSASQL